MNILITGIGGFVGQNLSIFLLNKGHTIYGLDRKIKTQEYSNLELFINQASYI